MNTRHQNALKHPLTTKVLELNGYLVDKGSQSRKIVQVGHIKQLIEWSDKLFYDAVRYLDGIDTSNRMLKYLYDIQVGAYLVSAIENEECRKRMCQSRGVSNGGKVKRKKHYGFDAYAVSYIDLLCDELMSIISSYGQHPSGDTK